MQKNIENLSKSRILLFILIPVILVLIGMLCRSALLSERNASMLANQLATEQAARLEAQSLSEQTLTQLKISRSRELAALSGLADDRDAALKVLLAIESLKALKGMDLSNPYPSWTQQSFYDSLSNIGGLPLRGAGGDIASLAFSPDGSWLATGNRDATVFLWNMQTLSNQPIVVFHGEISKSISKVTFSSDGRWLAAGTANVPGAAVYIWDMKDLTGKPAILPGSDPVFSPDGKWLATGGRNQPVVLWNMQDLTNQQITPSENTLYSYDLAFSPDNKWLAISGDKGLLLWDIQDISAKPLDLKDFGRNLTFSPDGKWLAATYEYAIHLLDMKNPTGDSTILKGHSSYVSRLAFSFDSKWLASGGEWDYTFRLWDMTNPSTDSIALGGYELDYSGFPSGPAGLAFSPDGKQLATADNAGGLRLWVIEDPSAKPKVLRGHTSGISSIAFSPDGKILATGGWDDVVRLWDTRHPSIESTPLQGNEESGGTVKFSPNGNWMARSGGDGTARVWDVKTPSAMPIVLRGFETQPNVIFSQDNNWLVTSGTRIRLWKMKSLTANPIILGKKDEYYFYTMALSPDTNWLAAKPANKPVRLWNLKKLSEPPVILEYKSSDHLFWDEVYDLSFSPDGKWLAMACGDEVVRIWDMQSLKSPPITLIGGGFVGNLVFSLDGKWLMTTEPQGKARLWNMQNISVAPLALPDVTAYSNFSFSPDGKWFAQAYNPSHPNFFVGLWDMHRPISNPTLALNMNHGEIRTLAFSPSGKWLASNSWHEAIHLWDMQDLKSVPLLLHNYGRDTFALAFSPNEQWLATIGKENSVRLWQMNLSDLATRACQYVGRNLTHVEWDRYSFEEPYRATCPEWPVDPEPTPTP